MGLKPFWYSCSAVANKILALYLMLSMTPPSAHSNEEVDVP